MKRFILYVLVFFSPLFVVGLLYLSLDPFKVIFHYDEYYDNSNKVGINRSFVSTMTYLNQHSKQHYNSFIFGNSRSLFYEVSEWRKFLIGNSRCYHFDASSGAIKSLFDKVVLIDKCGDSIKNALVVMDHELLDREEIKRGYLYMEPPQLQNGDNAFRWHIEHIKAFVNPLFFIALIDYSLFKTYRPYMGNYIQIENGAVYDQVTNEIRSEGKEEEIIAGTYYTESKKSVFEGVQKPGAISKHLMTKSEAVWFKRMAMIFKKHHTDFRIVLGPQYDQIQINPFTLHCLKNIFGDEHVFDFTGVNKWNTDYTNYYEESHYRPHVASEVMNIIYN